MGNSYDLLILYPSPGWRPDQHIENAFGCRGRVIETDMPSIIAQDIRILKMSIMIVGVYDSN